MGAQVSWRDGAGLSGIVELSYSEIFIGRSMECAIRTDDPMVSRRHARIYFQDGRHIIEDLGSANGIYVAEQRTQMHVFNTGDNIRCGNLWVQYTSDGMMASPGQAPGFGTDRTAMVGGMPGFAGSGGFGGGGGGGFGSPPAAAAQAPSYAAPPAPVAMSGGGMNEAEFIRMQRRVDQLQSEVRLLRGGGDKALRMEELEDKVSRLESERSQLEQRCMMLEQSASQGGHGGVQIGTAQLQLGRAEEVVNGLNDVLSELRINVLAAEGAIEEWEKQLPRASYDLVREALRSCRMQMETVRDLMRLLRAEGNRGGM